MQRRQYLAGVGLLGATAAGGCLSTGGSDPAGSTANTRTGTAPPAATDGSSSTGADRGIEVGQHAARATVTTLEGREVRLSEYEGQKRMFWLFATWCPSCQQSAQVLGQHDGELRSVTVLAAQMHENAGYSGPSVREFVVEHAPETSDSDRWIWGTTGEETTRTFSPRGTVDIYYLVDEAGIVRSVDTVPGTSIDEITSFADG